MATPGLLLLLAAGLQMGAGDGTLQHAVATRSSSGPRSRLQDAGLTFLDRWLLQHGGVPAGPRGPAGNDGREDGAPASGRRAHDAGDPRARARPADAGSPTGAQAEARTRPGACAPAAAGTQIEAQRARVLGGAAAQLLLRVARQGNVGAVQRMMQVLPRECSCVPYRRHAVSRQGRGEPCALGAVRRVTLARAAANVGRRTTSPRTRRCWRLRQHPAKVAH